MGKADFRPPLIEVLLTLLDPLWQQLLPFPPGLR
jgi:hypothetical protein